MTRAAFIVGPSRSGTSVLARALGRHPRIEATEELHFYNLLQPAALADGHGNGWLWARLCAIQDERRFFEVKSGDLSDLPDPAPEDLPVADTPLLLSFFDRLARRTGSAAVVEQTPMNLYYRDEIRRDFPDALFFLMRRDPRAIIASQKMRWKVGEHGQRDIPARDLARVRHSGHPVLQLLLLRKTLKEVRVAMGEADVVPIAYEELVTDPDTILADLCARLGQGYDPAMRDVSDAGSSHTAEGGRKGFDARRLEGWRKSLNATETWLTERFYRDELVMPATGARPRFGELLRLLFSLPRAAAMALYYSAGGYGNLIDAVRRRFL
ncbi:sulfotransferase [Erythrobacter sp. SN021]|uniref:sulfotransferase family protein n=1 Tax=Erythrobacter sp. SN021 TaxID=2912574 RepID=UPI001F387AF9|nr:sulfotransferase [Erythrobacter sp. SN021]